MVFPKMNFEPNSKGEDYVWKQFKKILPNNYVSFHNYNIETEEADVVLLVPDAGILIIEIKGFYPQNVEGAIDNTNIILKNGNVERSPYKQCRRYRSRLVGALQGIDDDLAKHIVGVSVCFPYFSKNDLVDKHLDRLVSSDLIITREDLEDWNSLSLKLIKIFEKTNEIWIPDGLHSDFSKEDIEKVSNYFVPDFSFDEENVVEEDKEAEQDYSILIVEKSKDSNLNLVKEMYEKWKYGTKVFFFSSCKKDCEELKKAALDYIETNGLSKSLLSDSGDIFNLSVEYVDAIRKSFRIVNGEEILNFHNELDELGKIVSFNSEQYLAEHAMCDDMVVRAGAGTGKTYLLVSRIAYLCWKHSYSSEEIKKRIILITFTNDATDEMRSRLVSYFSNMFKLTYYMKYFMYAESVENMNISTIDSFGKKIISKFAFFLGLGNELSVTNGTMVKRSVIHNMINEYANDNELIAPSYQLEKFLTQIVDKLGNRSVDANELERDFELACEGEEQLGKLIRKIPNAIKEIEDETENHNQILMSHIIIYLRRIVSLIKSQSIEITKDSKVDYLFIDEFQDTDDTQIELVADFKKIYDFKLFVVGDPKQSIYRFRGASDDKAFDTLNEKIGYTINEYALVKNYRSNAQLLRYMDKAFVNLSQKGNLLTYKEKDKLIGVRNVSVPQLVLKYEINSDEDREHAIIKALQDFRETAQPGENLAILVRSNAEVGKVRDICSKHNIMDVDIDTGGKLYRSEAVIDLYKLLLALQNTQDLSCLFNLYTTSYVNSSLKKSELYVAEDKKKYFYENLPDSIGGWQEYVESIRKEPVLKVIRTIIDDVKPWQLYAQKCAGNEEIKHIYSLRYKNNLDKLFEKIAIEYNGAYLTLSSLIDFLKIMITTHQEEEEREIVSSLPIQCRTVHRAKGKEYTYVFFPFADERIRKEKYYGDTNFVYSSGNIGYSFKNADMEEAIENPAYSDLIEAELSDQSFEEARIFYVALTRAKKGIMYIKNVNMQSNKKAVLWQQLLEE